MCVRSIAKLEHIVTYEMTVPEKRKTKTPWQLSFSLKSGATSLQLTLNYLFTGILLFLCRPAMCIRSIAKLEHIVTYEITFPEKDLLYIKST